MKISIFGLGYVGAVTAGCLAKNGNHVIGVDVDDFKVHLINSGKTPISEKDLEPLLSWSVKEGTLKATTNSTKAIHETSISLICVGTPSQRNGNLDLTYIKRVCLDIGKAIAEKDAYHLVVIRSTVLPGTVEGIVIPLLEKHSNKKAGNDFGVLFNPEFLREASAVYDFYNPPKTVIGSISPQDGYNMSKIYCGITAPVIHTSIKTAELVKYADNSFHALKIMFANEIGIICKSLGIDSHEVMNIFCQDTKLNLSSNYLKPGFAFGGSCLPKDLRALSYFARHKDIVIPVLDSILNSNQCQIQRAIEIIRDRGKKKIGILGFSFKAGTDDLRESPVVALIETLLGQGFDIKIYDKGVNLSFLRGTNKEFIQTKIPHIASLMCHDIKEIISFAELIVIGNKDEEFINIFSELREEQHILDLVRVTEMHETIATYEGICW